MRLPSLRRTLIELVVVAAPLASAGCLLQTEEERCYDDRERNVRLPEPPPMELEALVRACEADAATCLELCNAVLQQTNPYSGATSCEVTHDATGHDVRIGYQVSTGGSGCPVDGRRPAGLRPTRKRASTIAEAHLARAAWYEGASVHAFVGLARELARHGAPARLRTAAQRAAVDEVHHARLMGQLAHARGATPPAVEVAVPRRRSLEALAIENATEGVVGETWAALIALWQAQHATDPTVRATYARIADDELRHAELALAVDAWARAQMTPAACARVEAARRRAVTRLARGVKTGAPPQVVRELGMPGRAAMQRLFADARARLWA